MESVSEEDVERLCCMGFVRESAKQALRLAKNDLNEAVAILTGDHPTAGFDMLYGLDSEPYSGTGSISKTGGGPSPVYGPALPPSYDEIVDDTSSSHIGRSSAHQVTQDKEEAFEFPVAHLFELENRVFTESWSIPYKREESLGRCLEAAIRLAHDDLCHSDVNCSRFMEKCLPEAFTKLLTSAAVHRWGIDIQEGIYDMLQLLVELIAVRLQHMPIPVDLLHVLAMVFNMDSEYNIKNRQRIVSVDDRQRWDDVFGMGKLYAYSNLRDVYGWLTDLINRFAEKKGFAYIKERFIGNDLDATTMAALLAPFGNCVDLLNPAVIKPLLEDGMKVAFTYVKNLEESDFKDKKVGSVCDMLATMKLICLRLSPEEVQQIDELRFSVTLRMLKSPHFNARMNALKEVTKLIEDSKGPKMSRSAISQDRIQDWLVDEKVLSIALEGNIDQGQYCEKIKNIVDFLGMRLSNEELTTIWKIQNRETGIVVDNIHIIVAAAAVKLNSVQIEHLVTLIKETWNEKNEIMREKLLRFIGGIGRECKNTKTLQRILELLWELAHLPSLKTSLVELALEEHLAVLSDPFSIKDQIKKHYVIKCVEDIREGKWVLPALKQLLQIAKVIAKNSFHKAEKNLLQELNKNYDIIKQVTHSLAKFHQMTVAPSSNSMSSPALSGNTVMLDGRYSHQDFVTAHLSFLQFILQEGSLYLTTRRAHEIWDTLVNGQNSTVWDRDTCFEWFTKGISDLEADTQAQLFQKEILKLDISRMTATGFACFKCFFESVNQNDNKLKKTSNGALIVEKMDLVGLDYLWKICINIPDVVIAESAIMMLLNVSYVNLVPRIQRDAVTLHRKFIDECYKWLEAAVIPLEGSMVAQTLLQATKVLSVVSMPQGSSFPTPSRSANLLNIERLLLIAERYIVSVEELHTAPRSILPHGASFHGLPLNLNIICEAHKREFVIQAHSNETVGSVRQKIAKVLKLPSEQIQFLANEKMPNKDHKLLSQLDIEDNHTLNVRIVCSLPTSSFSASQETSGGMLRLSLDLEEEKMLPGVVMAHGGQVFDMLYHLVSLDQPRITSRARSLLRLIPTDPSITEALDSIGQKNTRLSQSGSSIHDKEPSPKLSPHNSPRRLFGVGSSSNVQAGGSRGTSPTASTGSSTIKGSSSTTSLTSIGSGGTLPRPTTGNARETVRNLLNVSTPGLTMFQILYNLEVLSSRLMPTTALRDANAVNSARKFCEDFLDANGLTLILNILHKDAIRSDVDYHTRQGCYVLCLQLLRYLLCGQDIAGEVYQPPPVSSYCRRSSTDSAAGSGLSSGPPSLEYGQAAAGKAVQTMGVNEFTDALSCFIRVAWAAAAGNLQLVGSLQPVKDLSSDSRSTGFNCREASVGSIGSGASSGSENDVSSLQAGLCARQRQVSSTDTYIAKEAIEILVSCLQLRSSLLATFYSLPCINEFIIDVLVGSPQIDIRSTAVRQFWSLSQTTITPSECSGHQLTPGQFVLQTLLKARLPFWVSSTVTRGSSYRLLRQCKQYFELKCLLMTNLSAGEQENLQLNVSAMLEDEITWLGNFVPSEGGSLSDVDNALLAGHLQCLRTLLAYSGVDKNHYGRCLVSDLLHEFLFPSSKIIMDGSVSTVDSDSAMSVVAPKCSNSESRVAAYEVLVELANGNLENLSMISKELINMHHQPNPELANQWDYLPPVDGRSVAGFVGLKNGGATCYMNSVIQQLYMMPGVAEQILAIDDERMIEDSLLHQVQQVLGHLMESKLQFYTPERFWQVFRLWADTPVNIREQQDALDFFQAFIDQVDEQIKKLGREPVFKKNFQGFFSDQKICKDCPHRYEQEEMFFSLNVTVKNATLQDSLAQFVKGEVLEGSNAYFCEKCGVKVTAVKRLCIKTLPPLLCIQLKRFDYDWESNRAIKFDDFFKFPFVLDMEPYTAEGMAWRESQQTTGSSNADITDDSSVFRQPMVVVDPVTAASPSKSVENRLSDASDGSDAISIPVVSSTSSGTRLSVEAAVSSTAVNVGHINYELVGVVVHSGQANAGHYYSFIKERRGNYMTNSSKGKWYRFNDISVEEFEMTEEALESECFGGKYKAKVFDTSSVSTQPEERLRYWNAYLLFYERMEDARTPVSAKKSKVTMWRSPSEKAGIGQRQDSLKQLTELVHKGEKKGLFPNKMPASIQQVVREENLMFVRNRNVYDVDYFTFVRNLASKNSTIADSEIFTPLCLESLNLCVKFLFNTYFHTKSKLRSDLDDWSNLIAVLIQQSKTTCMWMVDFLASEGSSCIKPLLLECLSKEIREVFGKLLEKTMCSFFQMGGIATHKNFSSIIELLLSMLQRDVPDHCRQSQQYFQVLFTYVQMGIKACSHMFGQNGFKRIMEFLIGPITVSGSGTDQESNLRRWSSLQAREFGSVHATLATLILNCDVSHAHTEDSKSCKPYRPVIILTQKYLKMSTDMERLVFGQESLRYLREVVFALREVTQGSAIEIVEEMLTFLSYCNLPFSLNIMKMLLMQCVSAPCNELKPLFHCLMQLLLLEDPLQLRRLKYVIDGPQPSEARDDTVEGMLAAISHYHTSDSRRSYQIIKFLVNLANRCPMAKDYLLQSATRWQWAVNWLRTKMTDHYWNSQANAGTSNEDSTVQTFQRTISAQDTLAGATALLTEASEQMVEPDSVSGAGGISGGGAAGVGGTENDDATSSRSKSTSPVIFSTEPLEDLDSVDRHH